MPNREDMSPTPSDLVFTVDPTVRSSYSAEILTAKSEGKMLSKFPGSFLYKEDVFPIHFTKEQCNEARKRYKALPEEFYTKSRLPVVTPENF